ncbi:MAG: DUF58 domain-containing protein [Myxococcales bacterium]|nr:DUF58 domain-containing protein [Myxococcales bacterium]
MSEAAHEARLEGRLAWMVRWIPARVRRVFSRLRELFPWTPLGVVLTAAAYAALEWFAYAELDLVWLVVGYVGLGLTLLSPITVLAAAVWLKLRGPLDDAGEQFTLETGVARATGFRLPSLWYLPLVQIRWQWLTPPAARVTPTREARALSERVEVTDRGRFEHIERLLFVSDPFGISRVTMHMKQQRALEVLPRVGGLRNLPSLTSYASGDAVPHPMGLEDGDRLELSRYTPGDPARFIHWKVLGRTRKLMVRRPERALSVARRMAAFMVAGPDDDASAGAARLAIERRLLGQDWTFGTDLEPGGASDEGTALSMLVSSARGRARGGDGLSAFIAAVLARGPASLIVFAPPRPGPWLQRVVAVARGQRLRVVIAVDGVRTEDAPPWWRRLLSFTGLPEGASGEELEDVVSALSRAGAEVAVIDRGSGRMLGEQHRRGIRALDAGALASAPAAARTGVPS